MNTVVPPTPFREYQTTFSSLAFQNGIQYKTRLVPPTPNTKHPKGRPWAQATCSHPRSQAGHGLCRRDRCTACPSCGRGTHPSFLKPSDGCGSVPLPSWTEPESSGHPTLHLLPEAPRPHPGVCAVAIPVAATSHGRKPAQALGPQPQRAHHGPLPGAGLPCPLTGQRRVSPALPGSACGGAAVPFPEGGEDQSDQQDLSSRAGHHRKGPKKQNRNQRSRKRSQSHGARLRLQVLGRARGPLGLTPSHRSCGWNPSGGHTGPTHRPGEGVPRGGQTGLPEVG